MRVMTQGCGVHMYALSSYKLPLSCGAHKYDSTQMANSPVHTRIKERLAALAISPQRASLEAGLSKDYLRSLLSRPGSSPRSDALKKLALVLRTTPHWLLTGDEPPAPVEPPGVPVDLPMSSARNLPVYGLAAGSVLGALTMTSDPVEYVPTPPGLARVRDAYALIITGRSMEPKFEAGDVVFLNPHRPPRQGDHVVVQERRSGGTVVTIKRFERWNDGYLVTTQYNPLSEVRFRRDQIIAVHRVLTVNELFGI
ncbi:S24 family peptidase [Oceaniradius stylonematis]|uniref:S24 family peptidase n=1 Tax=Oceaniradius stylonematis TaxID=2184161 RepID=UPI003B5D0608